MDSFKTVIEFILALCALFACIYEAVSKAIELGNISIKDSLDSLTRTLKELKNKIDEQAKWTQAQEVEIIGLKHSVKELFRRIERLETKDNRNN